MLTCRLLSQLDGSPPKPYISNYCCQCIIEINLKISSKSYNGVIELVGCYIIPLLEINEVCLVPKFSPIIGVEVGHHRSTYIPIITVISPTEN